MPKTPNKSGLAIKCLLLCSSPFGDLLHSSLGGWLRRTLHILVIWLGGRCSPGVVLLGIPANPHNLGSHQNQFQQIKLTCKIMYLYIVIYARCFKFSHGRTLRYIILYTPPKWKASPDFVLHCNGLAAPENGWHCDITYNKIWLIHTHWGFGVKVAFFIRSSAMVMNLVNIRNGFWKKSQQNKHTSHGRQIFTIHCFAHIGSGKNSQTKSKNNTCETWTSHFLPLPMLHYRHHKLRQPPSRHSPRPVDNWAKSGWEDSWLW